ncbi:MAG: DUF6194 family protein [Cyanobacteria bacterium P01_E01_bin.6]
MSPEDIISIIETTLCGVVPKESWGETSLFYNPGMILPNGVYFCTLKCKNGNNDRASALDRAGVFRVAIGLHPETYMRLFGPKPTRPAKGGVVLTDCNYDFTTLDELMPHPIYAWMGWAQILCPSSAQFERIFPLIEEAHQVAVEKFKRKTVNYSNIVERSE